MQKDPVCGMAVDEASAAATSEYKGKTYYFCAPGCKERFDQSPERYITGTSDHPSAQAVQKTAHGTPSQTAQRVDLPIRGMSCASCAANIQKGLSHVAGVSDANVNFATEKATITFDPDQVGVGDFIKTVKDLGYGARVERVTVPVRGMSCASCVEKVQKALSSVPGVVRAAVNFATEKATVE